MTIPRCFTRASALFVVSALTALAAVVGSIPLAAQSSTGSGTSEGDTLVFRVDPIVVTATRGPRELSAIPRPISVVQRRDIFEKVPNSVGDLFRDLPGLDVTGVGVNQARPQIRGQRGQRILLLSDGLRINNSRRQSDFGEIPALVDVNGVERVEVVRGPASVLYGSDAIGGVVNIINRVPQIEGMHGTASFRRGTVEEQNSGSARVYGRFGGFNIRAGGTLRKADSYLAPSGSFGNIVLADETEVRDTGVEDKSFDLRLGFDAGGQHSVFGKIEGYTSENSGFGSVDPALYDPEGTAINIRYPEQSFTKFSAGYRGQDLGTALADQFELLAYGQDNERGLNFGIGPFGIGPGMSMEIDNRNFTDIRSYGLRAEARKLATPGLLLTYGVDIWKDRAEGTDNNTTIMTGFGPSPIERVDETPALPEASYLSLGTFFQGEVEATDRFSIVAGARWQHVAAETFATPGLDSQTPVSITDGTIVAAANALFRASDHVTLVGSVGRAFRSPNLIERFFDGPTPEGSGYQIRNEDLAPEKSVNVDVGVRYRKGRVGLEAFAFRNRVFDGIRIQDLGYEIDGQQAHQNVNVEELIFRGVEFGGDADLGSGVTLNANYTWMDSKDALEESNPVVDSFSSKLVSTLRYQAPNQRFYAAVQVRHNGERKDVELEDNPIGEVLPAFTTLNLRSGVTVWRSNSGMTHRLNAALTNLTNELYAEFSNASFFRPEPKRNLTLTWEVSF
jgi:outer membrane receptor protein involved in Fe transport